MRWPVAAALVLLFAGCGEKTEQSAANQSAATENSAPEIDAAANVKDSPAEGYSLTELPPADAALRFVGTWATDKASCASKPWHFTKEALTAVGGPHCSIYNVSKVPGGYDLAVQCPAKKPDPTDLIKLRFAESARAMLLESNAIEPKGLIYCGK